LARIPDILQNQVVSGEKTSSGLQGVQIAMKWKDSNLEICNSILENENWLPRL
jgi:hypothetical protein